MSKKMMAIYCLLFVLIVTLVFSHFVDIPHMKEGFDSLSQMNNTDETTEEDTLLDPVPPPGDSSSEPAPAPAPRERLPSMPGILTPPPQRVKERPPAPAPKEKLPSVIQDNVSKTVESFQTRNNHPKFLPKKNKPKSEGVFDHIFTDKKSEFKLKHF
jgi:hypothetical protein